MLDQIGSNSAHNLRIIPGLPGMLGTPCRRCCNFRTCELKSTSSGYISEAHQLKKSLDFGQLLGGQGENDRRGQGGVHEKQPKSVQQKQLVVHTTFATKTFYVLKYIKNIFVYRTHYFGVPCQKHFCVPKQYFCVPH